MPIDISTIISKGFTGAAKDLSDILHSWITTKKDKQVAQQDADELSASIQASLLQAQQKAIEEANEADANEQKELTERLRIDMTSDSWLSKNVRPVTLLYFLLSITVLIILDSGIKNFKIESAWIDLLKDGFLLVLAFYFGGRTMEKIKSMK